jgi:Nucleolar RNA-binding protein, Nop10p family
MTQTCAPTACVGRHALVVIQPNMQGAVASQRSKVNSSVWTLDFLTSSAVARASPCHRNKYVSHEVPGWFLHPCQGFSRRCSHKVCPPVYVNCCLPSVCVAPQRMSFIYTRDREIVPWRLLAYMNIPFLWCFASLSDSTVVSYSWISSVLFSSSGRFSPDDKYSRHRVTIKKRYGMSLSQFLLINGLHSPVSWT